MANDCNCKAQNIMILSCSGASREGRLSNRAAVELTGEGFGVMFCLAGIATGKSGFVQSAKDAEQMIVIDGCETACAKTILENAGVPVKEHIIVSQLAIQKGRGRSLSLEDAVPEDVAAVKYAARLALKLPVKIVFNSPTPLSPADQAMSKLLGGKCC
jgi:uncharacterized metal-binding protein